MNASSIVIRRLLSADVARVYQAWTDGDLLSQWFVPKQGCTATVVSDLRVGGRYRIVIRNAERTIGSAAGEYLEIAPPHRLAFTWQSDGIVTVTRSVVTLDLKAVAGGTELTLRHDIRPETEEGRAHERGWCATIESLEHFLNPGE
jgi:uncharacterized protein YndB with AHSA1/START domain